MLPTAADAVPIRTRQILGFWLPLAATWLMMAAEGPYVAAIIARLAEATPNLAAYGIAFAFAFIAEAPVIMVMTAANALVRDRQSFLALRRFVYGLNGTMTALLVAGLSPPLFRFVTDRLIGLPPDIATLTHRSMLLLIPWPAAVGYRRFYQGILVRHHLPRRVAYGTLIRLATMSIGAAVLAATVPLPGASIGALALVCGVVAEAVASRLMARRVVRSLLQEEGEAGTGLTLREIARFYYPLGLTSLLAIAVNPMVAFFVGHSRMAIPSLAVLPVVTGLVFVFRSGGIAYQEVAVALIGPGRGNERPVARVAALLAGAAAIVLSLILFTPLGAIYFGRVAGLPPELAAFSLGPARVLALVPALEYLLTFQRARLVLARRTRPITAATAVEVVCLALVLALGIRWLDLVGALAATLAILAGRVAGTAFLLAVPLNRAAPAGEQPAAGTKTGQTAMTGV